MTEAGALERPLSVLVVEDLPEDYETTRAALDRLGCELEVTWAKDYESAREHLITSYFSLIIVDLVLDSREESDPLQWGGMKLIWDVVDLDLQESRAVVVHTSYPDPEVERRAFGRYGVVDFIPKKAEIKLDDALVDLVEKRNFFGLKCKVAFDDGLSWEELVRVCTRRQNQALAARMGRDLARSELEALFRLAFSNCSSIQIRPMELGASGTGLVRVDRQFADGSRGSTAVAKFGDIELIQSEFEGWRELKDYLHASRATEVMARHSGLGLGLLEYRFLGVGEEQLEPFSEFCATASAAEAGQSLEQLFQDTCALWYEEENRVALENERLDLVYRSALGIDVDRLVKGYEFRFGKPSRSGDVVSYAELDRD
jgi:CheY-like chemotaxis protein